MEEDESDRHYDVSDNSASCHQVDEPAEDLRGTVAHLQEGEAGEDHYDSEAEERHAALGAVTEELRGAAVQRHTVEVSGSAISVSVARTEDRGAKEGIDKVLEAVDA